MQWLRRAVGIEAPPDPPNPKGLEPGFAEQSRARLIRTFELRLLQLREEDAELADSIALAAKRQDRASVQRDMTRRRAIAAEIGQLNGQLSNQRETANTIGRADANREQARLLQQGAHQLGSLVKEAETIDLDRVVDDYRDAAEQTHSYANRLAEPLNTSYAVMDGVDEEVEAMMQQAQEESRLQMPEAPSGQGGGGGATSPVTAVRHRRVADASTTK